MKTQSFRLMAIPRVILSPEARVWNASAVSFQDNRLAHLDRNQAKASVSGLLGLWGSVHGMLSTFTRHRGQSTRRGE
ncbi:MAG: hypothetical protein ACP5OP_09260 [Leptospirillia bacterium]